MSKVLIDRELLERLAECAETANRTKYAEAVYDLLTQPAADCGLEIRATEANYLRDGGIKYYDLIRKSDADARIAELEAQLTALKADYLEARSDAMEAEAELAALKAQVNGLVEALEVFDAAAKESTTIIGFAGKALKLLTKAREALDAYKAAQEGK